MGRAGKTSPSRAAISASTSIVSSSTSDSSLADVAPVLTRAGKSGGAAAGGVVAGWTAKHVARMATTLHSDRPRDTSVRLELHGETIAPLSLNESYRYLGVGDGYDHVRHRLQLEPKIQQLKREAVALMQSGLAAWQVVKALNTYVYPKVEYALRHLRPLQSQLQGFNCAVKRGLRQLLHLPQSATTEFF
ncbi:unnamed protein product [Peronospora destructor]|uniref:Uncharacterized protein n=1 Tax=Peronospora destructor TaxID=86335 RepID=A0AAV0T8Q6_9STRA|nr:unnamed protein product [Peronospora destructor]